MLSQFICIIAVPLFAITMLHLPSEQGVSADTKRKTVTASTYYISPDGKDSNTGTSPDNAWGSISRANAQRLYPADSVLFQGGRTFEDLSDIPWARRHSVN